MFPEKRRKAMARKTANLRKQFVKLVGRLSGASDNGLVAVGKLAMEPDFRRSMKKILAGADDEIRMKVYVAFGKDAAAALRATQKDLKGVQRLVLLKNLAILDPFKGQQVV